MTRQVMSNQSRTRRSIPMGAETILTNVAVLFLAATVWNYLRQEERLTPARKTWLLVASIFAAISLILQLFRR
jgi:hypothetical protein